MYINNIYQIILLMDKPITVDDILKKENVLLSSHECNRCKKKFI